MEENCAYTYIRMKETESRDRLERHFTPRKNQENLGSNDTVNEGRDGRVRNDYKLLSRHKWMSGDATDLLEELADVGAG